MQRLIEATVQMRGIFKDIVQILHDSVGCRVFSGALTIKLQVANRLSMQAN